MHSSQLDIIKQNECEEERCIGVSIITGDIGGISLAKIDTLIELGTTHMVLISKVIRLRITRGGVFKRNQTN